MIVCCILRIPYNQPPPAPSPPRTLKVWVWSWVWSCLVWPGPGSGLVLGLVPVWPGLACVWSGLCLALVLVCPGLGLIWVWSWSGLAWVWVWESWSRGEVLSAGVGCPLLDTGGTANSTTLSLQYLTLTHISALPLHQSSVSVGYRRRTHRTLRSCGWTTCSWQRACPGRRRAGLQQQQRRRQQQQEEEGRLATEASSTPTTELSWPRSDRSTTLSSRNMSRYTHIHTHTLIYTHRPAVSSPTM